MKTKAVIIALCCILAAAFALGAWGKIKLTSRAESMADFDAAKDIIASVQADRLIGIFVTREALKGSEKYDTEAIVTALLHGEKATDDPGVVSCRVDAKQVEASYTDEETGETKTIKSYEFEDTAGFLFCFAPVGAGHVNLCDPAFSELAVAIVGDENTKSSASFEGTLHVSHVFDGEVFYYNPVFQSKDGSVYAISGTGSHISAHTNDNQTTLTQSLEVTADDRTMVYESTFKLNTVFVETSKDCTVFEFNKEHELISCTALSFDDFRESLPLHGETSYLIVEYETNAADGEPIKRELYSPSDERISLFRLDDSGIVLEYTCALESAA